MKTSLFQLKLAGVKANPIPILYHLDGDFSVVFKITNNIGQFKGSAKLYSAFHSTFSNILKLLGEHHTIQKQDIFSNTDSNIEELIEGRTFNTITTYLVITKNISKQSFFQFEQKIFNKFLENIEIVSKMLSDAYLEPSILDEAQIKKLTKQFISQNFSNENIIFQDFVVQDEDISFTNKTLKIMSLVDVDENHFPSTIQPLFNQKNGIKKPVDILSFLHGMPSCDNLIYNQVIRIPNQRKAIASWENKKRRHSKMSDPSNNVCVEAADNVLQLIKESGDFLVLAHFGVLIYGDRDIMPNALKHLETNLARIGIIPSNNAYNQKDIFENSFPGNTSGLNNKYDLFETTLLPALCLLYKESIKGVIPDFRDNKEPEQPLLDVQNKVDYLIEKS